MQRGLTARHQVNPLPFHFYYWIIVLLVGLGLLASIYLSISHYRVFTDIGYRSFCAISRSINCDTVSQSPYAIFIGVPVPVWGVFGYAFLLVFLILFVGPPDSRGRGFAAVFCLSLAFSGYSVLLALISSFLIHAYCIVCIFTYAINFLLAFMNWLVRNRFESCSFIQAVKLDFNYLTQRSQRSAILSGVMVFTIMLIIAFFPAYWKLEPTAAPLKLQTGVTEDGHPWIGNDKAPIIITEYSDYLCFQCKKMNYYLRQFISKHPEKIKLVHRHFPMDSRYNPLVKAPFHKGAGTMALIAIHATDQDIFWPINDYLFSIAADNRHIDIDDLAEMFGLDPGQLKSGLGDPRIGRMLINDIRQGLKLGLRGTPSYVIDDRVYHGNLPTAVFRRIQSIDR
jgi:uncharacterized membrane protein/protein-disulfide isomerase